MTNQNLLDVILQYRHKIVEVIRTGAAWEIWMQIELMFLLRQVGGMNVAREVPYPSPYAALRLDLLANDKVGNTYPIELKVESANNAGRALLVNTKQDIVKIANYTQPNPGFRAVVAIGYSREARNALNVFAGVPANNAIYQEADSIGVLVVTV